MNLPMLLGVVTMAMLSGILITIIGYYVPFMIMSTIVASIGIGVLSTLKTNSDSQTWIGYEALFGLGIGAGLMQAVLIAQTVLSMDDIPTGTATLIFFQTLGGAIMSTYIPISFFAIQDKVVRFMIHFPRYIYLRSRIMSRK
jgi:hypothetical protein